MLRRGFLFELFEKKFPKFAKGFLREIEFRQERKQFRVGDFHVFQEGLEDIRQLFVVDRRKITERIA